MYKGEKEDVYLTKSYCSNAYTTEGQSQLPLVQ